MSKHDVDQVLLSLYRGGEIFETIFTYNTPFSPSHWLNLNWRNEREMATEGSDLKERVYFKHVNLYDIPKGIIPSQTYEMAEAMREENLQEWKHVIMRRSTETLLLWCSLYLNLRGIQMWIGTQKRTGA